MSGPTTVRTGDRLRLQLRYWPLTTPRGTVLIVHGLGEHSARYEALAVVLNRAGWSVASYDHRGHGRSEGARGTIAAPESLLADLAVVIDALRSNATAPLLLLGHSMGGLVAARFAAELLEARPAVWCRPVDGLVLSSPALDAGLSASQTLLLAVLGRVAPSLRIANGLSPAWLSRDAAVVRAYEADPLVHNRITPRLVRFIVDAGEFVRARAAAWRTRTLLLYAGADRCVAPAGSRAFAAQAPASVVQSREFPGLFHEIFNEPEHAEVEALLLETLAGWAAPR
jgi:alpha-beta hydrolase superfamily lysophospholipase